MGRLDGAVAIVTGAGSGIGSATAARLVREGAAVLATDVDGEAVASFVAGLEGAVRASTQDVTTEEDWERVFAEATEHFGVPTILVNNAGVYRLGPITELDRAEMDFVMSVNVTGVALGIKHASRAMVPAGGGSIVNLSSVAGIIGSPMHSVYSASKGAVRALTKAAAVELGKTGVRVNSVHPAVVDTPMSAYGLEQLGQPRERMMRAYPMRRFGTPDEVANAVLFLASDEASWITGAELVVDGGLTAQ